MSLAFNRGWKKISRRIRVPLGFFCVIVYFWLARPSFRSLLISLVLVVPGILLRSHASGHVTKNVQLTTTGPYAYTRNPLYFGSILIAFGFAVAARSIWLALLFLVLFILIYWPVILDEEDFLRGQFPAYEAYAHRVPRLVPRPFPLRATPQTNVNGKFSFRLYLKHREYNSILGALCVYLVLIGRIFLWR
ncbi:MAG: methyltransferase family protein [Acidobacteriaceae bacterium]